VSAMSNALLAVSQSSKKKTRLQQLAAPPKGAVAYVFWVLALFSFNLCLVGSIAAFTMPFMTTTTSGGSNGRTIGRLSPQKRTRSNAVKEQALQERLKRETKNASPFPWGRKKGKKTMDSKSNKRRGGSREL
jgi:hypothetical protein